MFIARGGREAVSAPAAPSADLPNGAMVERFDSYLYRARASLPASAQAEIDAINRILPSLKQTLSRIDTLDPAAQDARRLMSIHLPGLIDRYVDVPPAYRQSRMARARPSISASSMASPLAGQRSAMSLNNSLAATSPRSKRKAGSSSPAMASTRIEGQGADS